MAAQARRATGGGASTEGDDAAQEGQRRLHRELEFVSNPMDKIVLHEFQILKDVKA